MTELLGTDRMANYGLAHGAMLVVTVLSCVVSLWWLRRLRARGGPAAVHRVMRTAGWVFLIMTLLWAGWRLLPENFSVSSSLPLQFSDALRFIVAIALIWRVRWAVAVSFYWGLTLNLQSLITPDLTYGPFPWLSFSAFWVLHIVVFAVPVLFLFVDGYRPTWPDFSVTYLITLGWAAVAMTVNALTDTNYGYLNGAPESASILDVLGPWPLYIVSVAVLVAAVWALMTWPFTSQHRYRRRRRHLLQGGRTGAARR
ncbi:YwaF family protein [Nesterenkonia aerolata]|uniref:TIGR02206 family membrane protein n=1 Tax=Nesterenkonia aerolata TaxID=3074079 RepID=A0ABU2DSP5_9MICC|nr:TIGR02206 family membrane protein [Nesterenkonia sp. LY-0111]MDR8019431.1 TIGR02206 family membrane protein [Nesterenkonia sp. LY-0111]